MEENYFREDETLLRMSTSSIPITLILSSVSKQRAGPLEQSGVNHKLLPIGTLLSLSNYFFSHLSQWSSGSMRGLWGDPGSNPGGIGLAGFTTLCTLGVGEHSILVIGEDNMSSSCIRSVAALQERKVGLCLVVVIQKLW